MEAGNRQGVRNSSPAEWTGPENGWRLSAPGLASAAGSLETQSRRVGWRGALSVEARPCGRVERALVQILVVVATIRVRPYWAYTPEDRGGEGFRDNCVRSRVSRT